MKWTSHFVKYSLIFFAVSEIVFALIMFISADFSIDRIIRRELYINLSALICTVIFSVGCGYYLASFLIFHHKIYSPVFVVSLLFAMLALKADSGNLILRRIETFFAMPPFVMMCILFGISLILLAIAVIAQTRHNLMITHSDNAETNIGEQQMFM
jgi:hypothetical protein